MSDNSGSFPSWTLHCWNCQADTNVVPGVIPGAWACNRCGYSLYATNTVTSAGSGGVMYATPPSTDTPYTVMQPGTGITFNVTSAPGRHYSLPSVFTPPTPPTPLLPEPPPAPPIPLLPEPLVVGFSGSREGLTAIVRKRLKVLLEELQPTEVHHGDCVGSDVEFDIMCSDLGTCNIYVHPGHIIKMRAGCAGPRHLIREAAHTLERNRHIVEAADVLIAAPHKQSRGTLHTIGLARTLGKPRVIINPDGEIEFENGFTAEVSGLGSLVAAMDQVSQGLSSLADLRVADLGFRGSA